MNVLTRLKLEMLRDELEEAARSGALHRLGKHLNRNANHNDHMQDKAYKVGDHVAQAAAKHGGMIGKAASSAYHQTKAANHLGRAIRHAAFGHPRAAKAALHKAKASLKKGIHQGLSAAAHVK